jgi:hypothetical protein
VPPAWRGLLAGLFVALIVGLCEYNTVLNNAYEYGSTLQDSTIFATVMWRSGWLLALAPALGAHSFLTEHFSPILYLPNLVSYFYPGDRMSYYAIVYAIAYGALGFVAYRLVRDMAPPRFAAAVGAVAGLALFCSAPVFRGQWEPHMEVVSPVFAILMFRSWQLRRYRACLVWLLCNAALREDLAVIYAIPLGLLAAVQYLHWRSRDPPFAAERLRRGIALCAVSVACTVAAFAVQHVFFPGYGVFAREYYDPANLFGHLSGAVILGRAMHIFAEAQGLWVPLIVLAIAAAVLRDAELLVGAIALLPYALVNFLPRHGMAGDRRPKQAAERAAPLPLAPSRGSCRWAVRRRGRAGICHRAGRDRRSRGPLAGAALYAKRRGVPQLRRPSRPFETARRDAREPGRHRALPL